VIHIGNLVTELKSLYAFDVEIVKKTSFGPLQRVSLPKFPAIEIDGTVVFEGCDITREQLEAAIKRRL
jgi:hypothetical protein